MIKKVLLVLCLLFGPYVVFMGLWEFVIWGDAIWDISKWESASRMRVLMGYAALFLLAINVKEYRK